MSSSRVWLFRGLVAIAAGLMLASFIMPWWTADIFSSTLEINMKDAIRIYGHGLQHDLIELREYIIQDETPFYQIILSWIYLAASVGLVLFSPWLNGKKAQWLLGSIGIIYITYVLIAVFIIITGRLGELGFILEGYNYWPGTPGASAGIRSSLRFGYYLAYTAGGMCIALALLRGIIVGKPKNVA